MKEQTKKYPPFSMKDYSMPVITSALSNKDKQSQLEVLEEYSQQLEQRLEYLSRCRQ